MNEFTESLIRMVLDTEGAWDKHTRELLYGEVIDMYTKLRDVVVWEQVIKPTYAQAVALLRAFTSQRNTFGAEHFEWDEDEDWWVLVECCNPDCQAMFLQGALANIADRVIGRRIDQNDMYYMEPTKEEVLALGIRPNLVPGISGRGFVQTTLF